MSLLICACLVNKINSFEFPEIEVPPTTLCYTADLSDGAEYNSTGAGEELTNPCFGMHVCIYYTYIPAVEPHFNLPSAFPFCSLNLLPSLSGKRLLWNPSH